MTDIAKEIAPSCLHDLILRVFGREETPDHDAGLYSDRTSNAVEYPAIEPQQENPNEASS